MTNTKVDTFENIHITVRARRGADVWDEFTVKSKLPASERETNPYRVDKFVEFVTCTITVDNLPFTWPRVSSSETEIQAGYQQWCDMSPQLMIFWANLIYDANQPPLPEENTTPGNA